MTTAVHAGTPARTGRAAGPGALGRLLDAGWDDLLDACPPQDPLRRGAWLAAWRRTVGAEAALRAVMVERGGRLVAAAPIESARTNGLRVVRHLGHADAWFRLAPPARDDEARVRLLAALAAEPGDVLLLDGIPADEGWDRALADGAPGARLEDGPPAWRLTIADPPRSVHKQRKEVGRAERRATARGVGLTTRVSSRWEEIGPRVDALLRFQARNFRGGGPNLLAGAGRRLAFARAGIAALGGEERARLVELVDDRGRLLAFDLAFVAGTEGIAYAGAFDRSRSDLRSLGWASMLTMVDALADEGVEVVDFGAGPAGYKDLIARPEPLRRATAPLSPLGRAALTARGAARALRGLGPRPGA